MSQYIRNAFVEEPIAAIRAGKTGQPQELTKGGQHSRGKITFADNPTAADTITLNGVWIEFSASASDFTTAGTEADPYLINIKADLSSTLDEVVTQTNGSANTDLSVATYSKTGTDDELTVIYDTRTSDGDAYTLAASADTVSGATLTGGDSDRDISVDTENTDIAIDDDYDQYFSLPDGSPFQRKTLVLSAKGTGNAVITPSNFNDGTTVTLDTAKDYAVLQFIVDEWKVVGTQVATVA